MPTRDAQLWIVTRSNVRACQIYRGIKLWKIEIKIERKWVLRWRPQTSRRPYTPWLGVVVGGNAYSTRIQSDVATDRLSISVASGRIDRQTREMPRPRLGIWYKTLIGEPLIPLYRMGIGAKLITLRYSLHCQIGELASKKVDRQTREMPRPRLWISG